MSTRRRYSVLLFAAIALGLLATSPLHAAETPVTLEFLFRGGDLQEALVERWIAEFEAENPDIRVEWREAAGDWMDQMPVWIASGTGPDVFEMWGRQARDWAEQGMLLDLAGYVERDFTKEDLEDFFPPSWEAGILDWGPLTGLQYGIPSYGNVFPIYYNKTLFDEAGVPTLEVLDRQGDWTWEGLIDIGRRLTRRGPNRITHYALDDDSIWHPTARGSAWIYAAGGKIFDFPSNPTHFMMDEPEALEGLRFMQDLIWRYEIVPPVDIRPHYDFREGYAAMHIGLGTGWLKRMELHVGDSFEWDIGPRPMGPAGRGYYLASDMFGINANTEHPEAAWRFVNYLTGRAGMRAHMEVMGRGPARRSVYEEYQALYPDRSTIYHLIGMMEAHVSPETLMIKAGEARPLIRGAVRAYVATNTKTPEQAIGEIADAVRALYNDL